MKMTNSFHGTSFSTRKTPAEVEAIADRIAEGNSTDADRAFVRRAKRALCGSPGCNCGRDIFRRQGPQED